MGKSNKKILTELNDNFLSEKIKWSSKNINQ